MIEAFRKRFPNAFVECAGVEDSEFFQRTFDGVVARGLMFLIPEDTQSLAIHKVARALNPNGRFLFTSPKEIVKCRDALTDRESLSLGAKRYHEILDAEGLDVVGERSDEGGKLLLSSVETLRRTSSQYPLGRFRRTRSLTCPRSWIIFPLFWKYEYVVCCRFPRCPGARNAPEYFSFARPKCAQGPSRRRNRSSP
jgi:hypothetical protein